MKLGSMPNFFVNTTLYRGFVAPHYRRQFRCFAQRAGVGKVLPWPTAK